MKWIDNAGKGLLDLVGSSSLLTAIVAMYWRLKGYRRVVELGHKIYLPEIYATVLEKKGAKGKPENFRFTVQIYATVRISLLRLYFILTRG